MIYPSPVDVLILPPVFEHLRLAKEAFRADSKTLNGTLETRSERAKQALQNIRPDVNDLVDYGTRKRLLNTKIEPNFVDSKKSNVVGGTCLDLFALNVSTDFASKNFVLFAKVLRTLLTGR